MVVDEELIPRDVHERIELIKRVIKNKCKTLDVVSESQHIQIIGSRGFLTKQEKKALNELGIEHHRYGARLYKERDEYRQFIKKLIEKGLLTSND